MKEDKQVAETNAIYNQRKKLYPKPNNRDINRQTQRWPNKKPPNSQQPCKFCLQLHLREAQTCPAWGKICLKCGKRNHFKGSTVCQGNVNNVNDQPDESKLVGALFIGSVDQPTETNISWEVEMPAPNGTINFKIDTGADVTVIPQEELTKLNIHLNELKQTHKKLTGPGNNKLKCIGYTYTTFQWEYKRSTELIYNICQNLTKALLGKPAINRLQVAKLNKPSTYSCNEISTIQLPQGHISNHKQPEENKFI